MTQSLESPSAARFSLKRLFIWFTIATVLIGGIATIVHQQRRSHAAFMRENGPGFVTDRKTWSPDIQEFLRQLTPAEMESQSLRVYRIGMESWGNECFVRLKASPESVQRVVEHFQLQKLTPADWLYAQFWQFWAKVPSGTLPQPTPISTPLLGVHGRYGVDQVVLHYDAESETVTALIVFDF